VDLVKVLLVYEVRAMFKQWKLQQQLQHVVPDAANLARRSNAAT